VRRIGFLLAISQDDPVTQEYLTALAQGLAPLGWREGHNVQIDTRLAGGEASRIRALATELASLSPDVILSHGTETSRIMQQASRMIPIVFTTVTDPIGSGLVASLAHPGGNITGFTNFEFSMAGKWLEFLKEAAPSVRNVTVVFNPDNAAMPGQLQAIARAAPSLDLQVVEGKVRDRAEIERVIVNLPGVPNAGLLVLPEFLTSVHRDLIVSLATRQRIPAVYGHRYFTESGGFISYGAVAWQRGVSVRGGEGRQRDHAAESVTPSLSLTPVCPSITDFESVSQHPLDLTRLPRTGLN